MQASSVPAGMQQPHQPVIHRLVWFLLPMLLGLATAYPANAYDQENIYPIASLFPEIPDQNELVGRRYGIGCADVREKQTGPIVHHYWGRIYSHTSSRDLGIRLDLNSAHYAFECIGNLADHYSNALAEHARWGTDTATCEKLLHQLEDEVRNVYLRTVCPLPGMECSERFEPLVKLPVKRSGCLFR